MFNCANLHTFLISKVIFIIFSTEKDIVCFLFLEIVLTFSLYLFATTFAYTMNEIAGKANRSLDSVKSVVLIPYFQPLARVVLTAIFDYEIVDLFIIFVL